MEILHTKTKLTIDVTVCCLTRDSLGVDLPQAELGDVGREVTEQRVLHGKHVVALALKYRVVHLQDVLVWPERGGVLVLAAELLRRHAVAVDRLDHHLVSGGAVLGQVDTGEPALAYQLHQVVLGVNINLHQTS